MNEALGFLRPALLSGSKRTGAASFAFARFFETFSPKRALRRVKDDGSLPIDASQRLKELGPFSKELYPRIQAQDSRLTCHAFVRSSQVSSSQSTKANATRPVTVQGDSINVLQR
jgi:hypothetical protein